MEYKVQYGYVDEAGFMVYTYVGVNEAEDGSIHGMTRPQADMLADILTNEGYLCVCVVEMTHTMYDD